MKWCGFEKQLHESWEKLSIKMKWQVEKQLHRVGEIKLR